MRALVILFAYVCAAAMAPVLMVAYGAVTEGVQGGWSVSGYLIVVLGFFTMSAAIYAFPVAVPVIALTELRKSGDWKVFALAGIAQGCILTVLFTEVPFSASSLADASALLPIVLACVMTYWLVAWKWLPPRPKTEINL